MSEPGNRHRRRWTGRAGRLTRLALLGLALVLLAATLWPQPPVNRLAVNGQPFFLAGVNYPWKTGQDFGNGGWGHSGVSDPTTYAEVDTDFANMAAMGVRVVKWRVFQDGRYGIRFDGQGNPVGLDDYVFKDVDAALTIARKHNIYLVFTLFDSGLWATNCISQGVQMGGHADLLTDPIKRQELMNRVVIPFIQHVTRNGRVVGYELIAEPDWGVHELNPDNDGRIKLSLDQVRTFVRSLVGAVRSQSNALLTVEANRSRDLVDWRGLGLDYYSFSWYDWLEPYDPLNTPASHFGLNKPIVIGEFPAQSTLHPLDNVLNIAWQQGYAGAFVWSYAGIDKYGSVATERTGWMAWVQQHWPTVGLFAAQPVGLPALIPQPFAVNKVKLYSVDAGLFVETNLYLRDHQDAVAQLYATPIGQTQPIAQVKDQVVPGATGQATIYVTLTNLVDGRPYKLSLGLFDSQGHLVKWFDQLANVELSNGKVQTPKLSDLALENACHG